MEETTLVPVTRNRRGPGFDKGTNSKVPLLRLTRQRMGHLDRSVPLSIVNILRRVLVVIGVSIMSHLCKIDFS